MMDQRQHLTSLAHTNPQHYIFHEIPKNYLNAHFNAYFLTLFKTIVAISEFQNAFLFYFSVKEGKLTAH